MGFSETRRSKYLHKLIFVLYRKTAIISRGLIFVQKAFWESLFSPGLNIGGSFALQKWFGLYLEGILDLKMLH